jgi:hypothetical protein
MRQDRPPAQSIEWLKLPHCCHSNLHKRTSRIIQEQPVFAENLRSATPRAWVRLVISEANHFVPPIA